MSRKAKRPTVIDQMTAVKRVARELRALERDAAALVALGQTIAAADLENVAGRLATALERAFAGKAAA